jgi:hypothetical protein
VRLVTEYEKVRQIMREFLQYTRPASARRRITIIATLLCTASALLGVASPALATPKGPYAVFADCPTVGVPEGSLCSYAQTTSGEFTIGNTTVPINQTITLQGGAIPINGEGLFALIPAKDGNSLSKTELNVPGGLLDLVNCTEIKGNGFFEVLERDGCKAIFENKTTGVTATTELVANEHNPALLNFDNFILGTGTALTLPVRVHLKNPLLGNNCYIGSETSPLELQLTDGTTSPPAPNKPISGKIGSFSTEEEVSVVSENSLVDNSFAAPTAEGCGGFFSFLIDPILNTKIGLPAAAGHNTANLSGTLKLATVKSVTENE